MHEDKRHFIRTVRMEAGTQQWHAISVRALHRLYFFPVNVRGDDGCAGSQGHFQERLCLIFYRELYLSQRAAFHGDQSCDYSVLGDRGKHGAVWKARPLKGQRWNLSGLAMIA